MVYLESNQTQADTDIAFINVEYHHDGLGDVGFSVRHHSPFRWRGRHPGDLTANPNSRKDLDLINFRAHGNPLASMMPNWFFAFEYVSQAKGRRTRHHGRCGSEVDADGYYIDIGYTFPDWPWAPAVTARQAYFSGDDPNTAKDEPMTACSTASPTGVRGSSAR